MLLCTVLLLAGCSGNNSEQAQETETPSATEAPEAEVSAENSKGVGPIQSLDLQPLDTAMAAEGQELFESLCTACHRIEQRHVGPPLAGITERRTPEWIMNMILNPTEMVQQDPIAKELLAEYLAPMADQNLTEDQARKILEYFRQVDEQ